MAKTSFATNDALTKKLWEEDQFRDWIIASYFSKFMEESSEGIIRVEDKFEKDRGDTVTFGMNFRLQQDGVGTGEALEGNEERLNYNSTTVSLVEHGFAVRDRGALDRQRTVFNIDADAQRRLEGKVAEWIDLQIFNALFTSPTKTLYPVSTYSADTSITANDKVTLEMLSRIKAGAITGFNRRQTPLQPVMVEGKPCFVFLTHPDSLFDLYESPQFQQAMREAEKRGNDNPLFTGAIAFYNGVIIHEHERVPIVTNFGAGSNIPGTKSIFMGQSAINWAWGKRPHIAPVNFNYENEHGYGTWLIYGVKKPTFTYPAAVGGGTADYGSIEVHSARTQISDL
jgi:N4-gp56 family major capsid protein